ncbi:ATP-dependent DNA helicase DinG [Metabacillus arenae]|uniref:3'-5' exonuclease DinG n=1 Tax=Metabacillus arenae TaxID=2771434 RepID=A0A926NJF6_9BACI|nr:ATP-dependent DNA helicase DinG [Metabacillus arenae]MBD1381673.1 ATP-dependent DNA helicase DinG [Metabacillus arenae]
MQQKFVVLDVETTGNSPKKGDKIIQVAVVVIQDGQVAERFTSFVNPRKTIPPFIEQFTGISNEHVQSAPDFSEIANDLVDLFHNAYFVAHNVHFDLSFIQEELTNNGFSPFAGGIIDTVELARMVFPTVSSYKLSEICQELGIVHLNPHRADSDAEVTAQLFIHILSKLKELPVITLQSLQKIARSFISDMDEIFDHFIHHQLLQVDQKHYNEDVKLIGTLAVKKEVSVPNRDFYNDKSDLPEFNQYIKEVFEKNGFLSENIQNYRYRKEQALMAETIYDSFNAHEHTLLEAETGTGKTVGYLIPSIYYSLRNQKKIMVSTHTTTLQHQIMDNEIKTLKESLPFDFHAAVLKGHSHYINLKKFEKVLVEEDDNYDSLLTKAQILIWLTETESGDRDELNLPSGGRRLWERICGNGLTNNNNLQNVDYYHRARKKAECANLVITNHTFLLLSCLNGKEENIDYDELIIDEAHHLERIASTTFGEKLDYLDVHFMLSRFGNVNTGLLREIYKWSKKRKLIDHLLIVELNNLVTELNEEFDLFFSSLHTYVKVQVKDHHGNRLSYQYDCFSAPTKAWSGLMELARRIQFFIRAIQKLLVKIEGVCLLNGESALNSRERNSIGEFTGYKGYFSEIYDKLDHLFLSPVKGNVTWLEIEAKGAKNAVTAYAQPIMVSEQLADQLFASKHSAVLISSSLTVENSFSFMIKQLGLEDFYPKTVKLPSPYELKEQVKLVIPTDIPIVNEVPFTDYISSVSTYISELSRILSGKTLILFTSYQMLKATYQALKKDRTLEEFVILAQGISGGSQSKLTKNFNMFDKALLLGTSSFWEGIDLKSEEIKSVMIMRLPFASPDDPYVKARCDNLKNSGADPFFDYSVPEAVLRFKQGFGRLIRSHNEKGILFVFDRRIKTASYGKHFISSIPKVDIIEGTIEQIKNTIFSFKENI